MSWGFFDNFHLLLDQPATLSPTFFGAAQGDLIVGNCLIDIKTTIRPLEKFTYRMYQLLGYTLLDWEDTYQIREVAIYFSRQQFLLKWSLDELIKDLSGSDALTLSELRQEWHNVLTTPRYAPAATEPENVTTFPAQASSTRTPRDAERRFFARYADVLNGATWNAVETYLGYESSKPTTVEEWHEVALEMRARADDEAT